MKNDELRILLNFEVCGATNKQKKTKLITKRDEQEEQDTATTKDIPPTQEFGSGRRFPSIGTRNAKQMKSCPRNPD
jgi:hypothetical protein